VDINPLICRDIVERALVEDIGSGDITTLNIFGNDHAGSGLIIAKEKGIIAGLPLIKMIFKTLGDDLKWDQFSNEGDQFRSGDVIAEIRGKMQRILTGERVALNFLQRLSAIATITRAYVEKTAKYDCLVLDTRKTTPGLRVLEKYAVRVGGGVNHRLGLYDAALVKDNHIRGAGSIKNAVTGLRKKLPMTVKIEVEVENINQVREALEAGADIIMLDNMPPGTMKEAVGLIDGKALVEASGNITLDNVESVAETGVDYISVGALTHSVRSLDISMEIR